MPRIDINHLSDDAYAWIFGISPRLDDTQQQTLLRHVDAFLAEWAAHGRPITSAREVREGSFLVIAAENSTERSGCSIDRLFGTLKRLEGEFGVSILDAGRVFRRTGAGGIEPLSRAEFSREGHPDTVVFDTTSDSLGEIRSGRWQKRAADSWHRSILPAHRTP